jgi:hypothetical protein
METQSHPSYGMIGFSRVSTRNQVLFGSSVKHDYMIQMVVKRADVDRDLNRDWYHGRGTILELYMTPNQFIEAITKMNHGDGVPATLYYTEKDGIIEECKFTNERTIISNEFKEQFDKLADKPRKILQSVLNLLAPGKPVKKSNLNEVVNMIKSLDQELGFNIPWMRTAVDEMMEKNLNEARSEIEAAFALALHNAGIDHVGGDVDVLLGYIKNKDGLLIDQDKECEEE